MMQWSPRFIVPFSIFVVFLARVEMSTAVPIKLSVFYETLCPDSIRFITGQLHPTFLELGGFGNPFLHVEYVPYGKASTTVHENGTYSFQCQHGVRECEGNLVHTCALAHLPEASHTDFVHCSMGSPDPPTAGEACAAELELEFANVQTCLTNEGPQLLAEMGILTHSLDPALYYVPWILYDDVFSVEDLQQSQLDLLSLVCKKLDNAPPACNEKNLIN